ncbi:12503_t:CDS:1, partial [Dentiscutata heterogama]
MAGDDDLGTEETPPDFTTLFQQFLQSQHQLNQYFAATAQQQQERQAGAEYRIPGIGNDSSKGLTVQLPIFSGKDGENVLTWLLQVDLLFKARKVEDMERLQYVITGLKDAALQ